ncbi:MAG: hypothetical protein NZ700_16815 [Gemmataceae bacterium]|nr:hypothetical protein [Gemmataceae bacterium]MDW8266433.1 hypothetical protein [Gemmataceae bacterium]
MNGFMSKSAAALGLVILGGCGHYKEAVDPCWPERYNAMARKSVCEAITPQVTNGHVLAYTVWNWHFDQGTDTLNAAGRDFLTSLVHKRPSPDSTIYLATAQDLGDLKYDPKNPDDFVNKRAELDAKRVEAVQKYLAAQTFGRNVHFQVVVHDPAVTDLSAQVYSNSAGTAGVIPGWYGGFRSSVWTTAGGTAGPGQLVTGGGGGLVGPMTGVVSSPGAP